MEKSKQPEEAVQPTGPDVRESSAEQTRKAPGKRHFLRREQFPEAHSVLTWLCQPLTAIKDDAVILLDTNALLVPYATGKDSLAAIAKIYETLIASKRLTIPGQVAREFAVNRTNKMQELHQHLCKSINQGLQVKHAKYPLFEGLGIYDELMAAESELERALSKYRSAVKELKSEVENWGWGDPVSKLYQKLFDPTTIAEPILNDLQLTQDIERRVQNKIPPGYKDASKDDGGAGDIIIWNTILAVGAARKCNMIFVSADRKPDWWCQSGGEPLYPRFELIDEYRRASSGKTLQMTMFSNFLRLFGAEEDVVNIVRKEERDTITAAAIAKWTEHGVRTFSAIRKLISRQFTSTIPSMVYGVDAIGTLPNSRRCAISVVNLKPAADIPSMRRSVEEFSTGVEFCRDMGMIDGDQSYLIFVASDLEHANTIMPQLYSLNLNSSIRGTLAYVDANGDVNQVLTLDG